MFGIKYVSETDKAFWHSLDGDLSEYEFNSKIRDKRGYVISDGDKFVGLMRYNLFWDNTPFLTLIYLEESYRNKGLGKQAMLHWENEMRGLGYIVVMTSTQADEEAQHFYRKLGYKEIGGLFLHNTPYEQPLEMIMMKVL